DLLRAREVRDRAGEFDDAVVRAGGEVHLARSGAHQLLACRVQWTILAYLARPHIGVRDRRRAGKPGTLPLPCGLDPRSHYRGRFRRALGGQFLIGDARHVEMDINPVEQRATDPLCVAADLLRAARAGTLAVAGVATWARIHRRNE